MAVSKRYNLERELPDLERIPIPIRRKAVRAGVKLIALRVREIAPDSGRRHKKKLRKSIRYQVKKRGLEGVVEVKNRIAHIVHDGAAGHWIGPERKKAVAYKVGERAIVRRAVWHPGMQGDPFLTRAMDEKLPEVLEAVRRTAEEGIAEALAKRVAGRR